MVDVSVIIVSYKTRDLLRKCLDSVCEALRDIDNDVIVVDNCSCDGTLEMIKSDFAWVHLIGNSKNRGFAAANNQALRIAKGRYIVLLNPDTVVLPGAFDTAYKFLNERTDVGALGCQILNRNETLQLSCASEFPSIHFILGSMIVRATGISSILDRFFPNLHYPFKWWLTPDDHQHLSEVAHITGVCLWVRKEVFDAVGLLDEQYFMYFEETELCYRIRKKGWKIFYLPNAQVIHIQHASARTSKDFFYGEREFHFYKGRLIFFRTHHSRWVLACYRMLVILSVLAKLALSTSLLLLGIHRDEMRIRIRAYLRITRLSLAF